MHEQWRPIQGYEGLYEVSDKGRVRSLDRVVVTRGGITRRIRGRVLSMKKNHDGGYVQVNLCSTNGVRRHVYVHALVLEHFVGPRPDGMESCHGVNGPSDNSLTNLSWGTPSSNNLDKQRDGTDRNVNKTHCGACGFEYTVGNTIRFGPGKRWRRCRNCENRYQRNKRRNKMRRQLEATTNAVA